MKVVVRFGILAACLLTSLSASTPVGSISSKGVLSIGGIRLNIAEVPFWPVAIGDEIATASDPAMIFFDDGSRLLIDRASVVRIETRDKSTAAIVLSGSADFLLTGNSKLRIFTKDNLVAAKPGQSGTARATSKDALKPQDAEDRIRKWKEVRSEKSSDRSASPYR